MQFPLRINLGTQKFPLLSELHGRTVVIPGQDQVGNSRNVYNETYDQGIDVPCIYYAHNVIPTTQGFASVAYSSLAMAPADADSLFTDVFTLRDSSGNKAYLGVTSSGRNYILQNYLTGWVRSTDVAPLVAGGLITTAYVNGVTYIYYANSVCKVYNFATGVLDTQVLTGLTAADIVGICTSNGYLLAFSNTALYWSSTLIATTFTPSLITGAGGGAVQDLKGIIVTVKAHSVGFVIYGTYNCVSGTYSSNIRYPFSLKEVVGSGGLPSSRYVDIDPVSGDHYAYTTSGMQLVSPRITNTVFPDLTDFLGGAKFEDFDESTCIFSSSFLTSPMVKKVTSIADRYLVISYGVTQLTHAVIYDTALQRMGKLKITHVDCFEYLLFNTNSVDTPRNCMGFLKADGSIKLATFSMDSVYASGCIIFGKFQLVRQQVCDLQKVAVDNVRQDATFSCRDLATLDGKTNLDPVDGYLATISALFREYNFRKSGLNHSIVLTGAFNLVSVVLKFSGGGVR